MSDDLYQKCAEKIFSAVEKHLTEISDSPALEVILNH